MSQRAHYQNHKNLGFRPKVCASPLEIDKINKAIVALNKAKSAKTEKEFLELVSTGFNYCRTICRGRIL